MASETWDLNFELYLMVIDFNENTGTQVNYWKIFLGRFGITQAWKAIFSHDGDEI